MTCAKITNTLAHLAPCEAMVFKSFPIIPLTADFINNK